MFLATLQAAVATMDASRTFDVIVKIAEIAVLPLIAWMNKKFGKVERKLSGVDKHLASVDVSLAKINVTLIGQDGNNGHNSRLRKLEDWRNEISSGGKKLQ